MLCNLGTIAFRATSTLKCDPNNGHILGNKAAAALWSGENLKGWELKV